MDDATNSLNLLPRPRALKRRRGHYLLPRKAALCIDSTLPHETVVLPVAKRLRSAAKAVGVELKFTTNPRKHSRPAVSTAHGEKAPDRQDGYALLIDPRGIAIYYHDAGGLRAAVATLRQLLREYGRRLPCLVIRDYPDFERRGVMLDISRGRVPKLSTLLELLDHLADFKINEFQLYTEHTFAYRNYRAVWHGWGPLTGGEIRRLGARARELGIDLVPNQNSFGHLRYWLAHPPLKKLAEVSEPYKDGGGTFLRHPTTLAPNHPGTLPFLRGLFDELLPNFTSDRFNVGCDETWDLGRGQSKSLCQKQGKGHVYAAFLKRLHREVTARGRRMMFWGDIILHYPELIKKLPKDVVALNWGYEADHPWQREAGQFAKSRLPFYACPGTSTWMTLIGRHDNAFANLRRAAEAGRRHGALGYLNTDWGDGGHPQPLAVSYAPFLLGAALSWHATDGDEKLLAPVLSRDVFEDPTQRAAKAALALGVAHRKLGYSGPNCTPLGAVIAAPPPATRELFCRDGLKYYARITGKKIRAALAEIEKQIRILRGARPKMHAGKILVRELQLAARMAAQSCKIMLWQQALAAGENSVAQPLARVGVRDLRKLDADFRNYWPLRNKGTTAKCSPFLRWRKDDFRRGILHFPPSAARG